MQHHQPKRLIIAQRYLFNQRRQHPGESITDYVAELPKARLAATCNFKDFIDDALRDRLVCGLTNESSSRRLLAEADGTTTFAKAVEMAQSFEQADKNARALNGQEVALKNYLQNHAHGFLGSKILEIWLFWETVTFQKFKPKKLN